MVSARLGRSPLVVVCLVLGIGAMTFAAVRVALGYLRLPGIGSPVWWPAVGLAVAVLIRVPRRWWAFGLVAFAAGYLLANRSFNDWSVAVTYIAASVVEVIVATVVLTGGPRNQRLRTAADGARFAVAMAAAIAAGMLLIRLSVLIVPVDAAAYSFPLGYATSHAAGLLTLAPLLLPGAITSRGGKALYAEFGVVLAVAVALNYWIFLSPDSDARAFPVLIPVVWAAIRLDAARTAVVTVVTAVFVAIGTAQQRGTFMSLADDTRRDLTAQALIGTVALCALALVLITRHRAELADHVRDSEAALRAALQDALVGMYTIRLDPRRLGVITEANESLCAMLGYQRDELVGQHCRVIAGWRRADGSTRDEAWAAEFDGWLESFAAGAPEAFRRETPLYARDGSERWMEISATRVTPLLAPPFAMVHVHDLTDREQQRSELEQMALHDQLTGLGNRTLLFQRLEEVLVGGGAARDTVGLLYLDLDGFKEINDTHGHAAGDAVLIEVAHRIASAVRPGDTVARLGGDEFAALCHPVPHEAALDEIAARIHDALRPPIDLPDGTAISVRASIGSALSAGIDVDRLVRAADSAMYEVKRARRGSVTAR